MIITSKLYPLQCEYNQIKQAHENVILQGWFEQLQQQQQQQQQHELISDGVQESDLGALNTG